MNSEIENRTAVCIYRNREEGVTLVKNDIADLVSDYLENFIEHGVAEIPRDDMGRLQLLIALSTAWSAFMPPRGVCGWNVLLPGRSMKFFASVDTGDGSFTARGYKYDPAPEEKSRVVMETFVPGRSHRNKSMVEEEGTPEMVKLLNSFLVRSEHPSTLFFESHGIFYLLKKDGGEDLDQLKEIAERIKEGHTPEDEGFHSVEETKFRFFCGCSKLSMKSMIDGIGRESIEFLFKDGEDIKAECPRCGRVYRYKREEFFPV